MHTEHPLQPALSVSHSNFTDSHICHPHQTHAPPTCQTAIAAYKAAGALYPLPLLRVNGAVLPGQGYGFELLRLLLLRRGYRRGAALAM